MKDVPLLQLLSGWSLAKSSGERERERARERERDGKENKLFLHTFIILSLKHEVGQQSEKPSLEVYRNCPDDACFLAGRCSAAVGMRSPCEGRADLRSDGLPLLPALPGEPLLTGGRSLRGPPIRGEPLALRGRGPAVQFQGQGVLPLHPAGQRAWTQGNTQVMLG